MAVSITGDAATNVITSATPHGFDENAPGTDTFERVVFAGLVGGAPLQSGVVYYVSAWISTTQFRVSATNQGSSVDFTTNITAGTVRLYSAKRRGRLVVVLGLGR